MVVGLQFKKMKQILIIGAGQIGSRHLQGVLKSNLELEVSVVDPNPLSLIIAKSRADEIKHNKSINFLESIEFVSKKIDIAIVATNANVREKIVAELLQSITVEFLILEKVLFQDLAAYEKIGKLIQNKNVKTWVNHPRRVFEHYQEIKKHIDENNLILKSFLVTGNNWGLGCNGLHLLDICSYLSNNSRIETINTNQLDKYILPSKREEFIEFTGRISVYFENNLNAEINSNNAESGSITIFIATEKDRWLIHESNKITVIHLDDKQETPLKIAEFNPQFQSNLSTFLVQDLITLKSCKLPTYKEACKIHKPFIKALLNFQNEIEANHQVQLKIT